MRKLLAGAFALLLSSLAHAATVVITWSPTTTACDGSAVSVSGYWVYWGKVGRVAAGLPASSGGCGSGSVLPTDPRVSVAYANLRSATGTTHTITLPDDGSTWYFALAAVDGAGVSSALSNEVSKVIPLPAESPPGAGTIINITFEPPPVQPTGPSDLFDGSGALSASWTQIPGHPSTITRVNGQAISTSRTADTAAAFTHTWTANQWVEVTYGVQTNVSSRDRGYGIALRASTTAQTYIRITCSSAGWEVDTFVAGTWTTGPNGATTCDDGDRLYAQIVGNVVTMKRNDVAFGGSITVSGAAATGRAGVAHSSSTNTGDGIAAFRGGNL